MDAKPEVIVKPPFVNQTPERAPRPADGSAVDDSTAAALDNQSPWGTVLGTLIGSALAVAGFLIGIGVTGLAGQTTSFWYLSRAAGFVAYLLLWGSMVWGLLLSSKIGKGRLRPPALLDAHEFLSNVALGFAFFHGLVLMGDRYLSFPLSAVLVPFASSYKTILVAAGQLGLWFSVAVGLTFYVRKQIGQRTWRRFHYVSFVAFWAVFIHATLMGTDSKFLVVKMMYLLTVGAVLFLTFFRIFTRKEKADRRAQAPSG